jgi:class 3 adenylate cyclase
MTMEHPSRWKRLGERVGASARKLDSSPALLSAAKLARQALPGDERALELLRDVGQAIEPPVADHGGRVVKRLGDYLGVDVNIAARLAESAGPGEVLLSATTLERLGPDAPPVKRKRRFNVKGVPKDLSAHSVQ